MTTQLADLDSPDPEAGSRLRRCWGLTSAADGPMTEDLLEVLEEMTMLDSTVQRRISILCARDMESPEYLVRVFGLGPGELTGTTRGRVVHGELHAGRRSRGSIRVP